MDSNINQINLGSIGVTKMPSQTNSENILIGRNDETIFGADHGKINDSSYNIYYKEGLIGPGTISGNIDGQDVNVAVYDGFGNQDITGSVGDKELNLESSQMLGSGDTKYTGVYDGKEVELMVSDNSITGTIDGEEVSINLNNDSTSPYSMLPEYWGKDDSGMMDELLPIINSAEDGPDYNENIIKGPYGKGGIGGPIDIKTSTFEDIN